MPFANLLDPNTFSRRDTRTLGEMLKARREEERAISLHNATVRQNDLANDSSEMGLQQQQAIQPGVLAELQRENEGMVNVPPHLAAQPQASLPPTLQAFGPQAPLAAAPDPYAGQQGLLDERAAMLDQDRRRAGAMVVSPILQKLATSRGQNLEGRSTLANDQTALQGTRDFAATVPDLEAIKNNAVQQMRGQGREESIHTWNGMISAIQSAVVAKNPGLLQNKGFQEYMASLEKLKPTPNPVIAGQGQQRQAVQQVIGLENQLRDEYEKVAGDSRTISRAGQDIAAALKTNNSLSIRTAVTKFSKIADPTTGVLGGEASATEKAAMGDLLNSIEGSMQRMATGGMNAETKANFEKATRDLLKVQKSIFERAQQRTRSRFDSYRQRFPDLNISLDAIMGSEADRAKEVSQFDAFPETPAAGPAKVADKAAYDALPSGAEYIGPSGKRARKP